MLTCIIIYTLLYICLFHVCIYIYIYHITVYILCIYTVYVYIYIYSYAYDMHISIQLTYILQTLQLSTILTNLCFTWQALDQLPAPPRPSASAPLRPSLTTLRVNLYLFKGGEETENEFTLWGTNISHLGKRNIIFKIHFSRDMFVPRRVAIYTWDESSYSELCSGILTKVFDNMCQGRSTPKILGTNSSHRQKAILIPLDPKTMKNEGFRP